MAAPSGHDHAIPIGPRLTAMLATRLKTLPVDPYAPVITRPTDYLDRYPRQQDNALALREAGATLRETALKRGYADKSWAADLIVPAAESEIVKEIEHGRGTRPW
jgi:hypothetical protein